MLKFHNLLVSCQQMCGGERRCVTRPQWGGGGTTIKDTTMVGVQGRSSGCRSDHTLGTMNSRAWSHQPVMWPPAGQPAGQPGPEPPPTIITQNYLSLFHCFSLKNIYRYRIKTQSLKFPIDSQETDSRHHQHYH